MYEMSDRVRALKSDLEDFMATHIYPSEAEFYRQAEMLGPWAVFPIIEELKLVARRQGLWNLWHGAGDTGVPLGNLEYASLCEVMGRCGACKTRLLSGEVDLLPHTPFALRVDERAHGLEIGRASCRERGCQYV